jgi:hypothetical protein
MVSELQANEDASLSFGGVVAGLGRLPIVYQIDPCRLDILGRLLSPWGLLLCVWTRSDLIDGLSAWTFEISSCGHVVAMTSLLVDVYQAKVAACAGKLVGPKAMSAGSERDVARSA